MATPNPHAGMRTLSILALHALATMGGAAPSIAELARRTPGGLSQRTRERAVVSLILRGYIREGVRWRDNSRYGEYPLRLTALGRDALAYYAHILDW